MPYRYHRQTRQEKRTLDGELNADQILTTNISNNILESITNQFGNVVSSPAGVNINGKTSELIFHNKILEAYISIHILNEPGKIAIYLDQYTAKLSKLIHKVAFQDELGSLPVVFNGINKTLREVFNATTFNPLSVGSDQIGRMPEEAKNKVEKWLYNELNTITTSNNFKGVLTKVKALSSFGTTLWQLLSSGHAVNTASLQRLFSASDLGNSGKVGESFSQFSSKTRSPLFDDPVTRARSERMPLLNGSPVKGVYSDAATHGLGFGQVVQSSEDAAETEQLKNLLAGGGPANSQINAITRQNAPIGDNTRPYMLSEKEFAGLPKAYDFFKIKNKIDGQRFPHGVGINRWQPYGSYGTQANLAGFPSAGAQSGGTTDVMLALHMLSGGNIYTQDNSSAVEAITLAVAAFMNFGGYHTFSEVYPVGMSVARNEVMTPSITASGFRHSPLYLEVLASYRKFNKSINNDNIANNVLKFFRKYKAQTISHRNPTIIEE
ncbi:hypothetical protein [Serratia liquefaciens]|uniref:hypothetical protein n=1 Tax=Serratia liquefaciens TaxID=614 RepID=UPI00165CF5EB|nr:hypothetical protein [Serratia liquefaciens]QNQ55464.1 hypothetical protein IAI46_05610 [Serratia liquefaciens]